MLIQLVVAVAVEALPHAHKQLLHLVFMPNQYFVQVVLEVLSSHQ
jgi:hypothetical protein